MLLNLSDLSSESLQDQIARQVRARILAGDISSQHPLPSIRALARQQQVSVITVQRAYEKLMREGLIRARRGKGFFVNEMSEKRKRAMAVDRLLEKLEPHIAASREEGLTDEDIRQAIERILDKEKSREQGV